MGITFNEEKKVFLLKTKNTSYQFRVAEFGFLEHLYYGRRGRGLHPGPPSPWFRGESV